MGKINKNIILPFSKYIIIYEYSYLYILGFVASLFDKKGLMNACVDMKTNAKDGSTPDLLQRSFISAFLGGYKIIMIMYG